MMNPNAPAWLWLCCLLLAASPRADDWKLESDRDGIRIYTRKIAGSTIRQFRAQARLPASLDRVLAVYDDFDHYPRWHFRVARAGLLARPDERTRYHFQLLAMPFPVADRLFVLHSHIEPEGTDRVRIETRAVPGYCNTGKAPACRKIADIDAVRIRQAQGTLEFRQLDAQSTELVWIQHAEPAGTLPDWLINRMLVDNPLKTLERLRQQVTDPRYASARLRRDAAGRLLGGFEQTGR